MTEQNDAPKPNLRTPKSKKIFAENLAELSRQKIETISRNSAEKNLKNGEKSGIKRSYLLLFPFIFLSVGVVLWLNFAVPNNKFEVSVEQISKTETNNTEMTGARFASRTTQGENFEITAERAVDNTPSAGLIHLTNPNGTFWTKSGNQIKIRSKDAILDQSKELTVFQGNVRMNQTLPMAEIQSSILSIDLKNQIYQSDKPVLVISENMQITGQVMKLNQKNKVIFFGGNSKLSITEN
ncbi:LPS export ABC transporter periplasmic protein LptC [Alphaproteobacteria bacterium]|nr:LPS export ABC transporter periplasmic protein LptC [Alphaproteobacteria bacterium]